MEKYKILKRTKKTITIKIKYHNDDLLSSCRDIDVYRIQALRDFDNGDRHIKAGDIGGYVECAYNLSQEGNCWIDGGAIVCGDATVQDNAYITDFAIISGRAHIYENAVVADVAFIHGNCLIHGNAIVMEEACIVNREEEELTISEKAVIYGNAHISGNVCITGDAIITDYATVSGNAHVSGNACVGERSIVTDNAVVQDFANVKDHAVVKGNAVLKSIARINGCNEISSGVLTSAFKSKTEKDKEKEEKKRRLREFIGENKEEFLDFLEEVEARLDKQMKYRESCDEFVLTDRKLYDCITEIYEEIEEM